MINSVVSLLKVLKVFGEHFSAIFSIVYPVSGVPINAVSPLDSYGSKMRFTAR